jgi:glycosyltransferase involved in cell wall biosynthesis
MRRPISIVLIARNEAHRLADCLDKLSWADEIVLVDSGSTDATREIARRYTDRVFELPWRGFGLQKRAAVELAQHDMVLNVDCDEHVSPELAQELLALLEGPPTHAAYSIPLKTFIGSKQIRYSGWYPDRKIRLFDRTRAHFSESPVHERVVVPSDAVGACNGHILHYSFAGMSDLLAKLNRYTDIAAQEMYSRGKRVTVFSVTIRPLWAFFRTYVLYRGFLDGFEGLEVAMANAVTVFFKYAKLRELYLTERGNA